MSKNILQKPNKNLIIAFLLVIFSIYILYSITGKFSYNCNDNVWYDGFSKHFDVKNSNIFYKNVDLKDFKFKSVKNSSLVELYKTLPLDMKAPCVLVFKSYHSSVEIFVDNKLLYSYGLNLLNENKMVGSGFHFLPLTKNEANKQLKIRLIFQHPNNFKSVQRLDLCKDYNPIYHVFQPILIQLFISIFLISFGLLGFLVCITIFLFTKNLISDIMYLSTSAFFLGIWSNCNYKFFQLLSHNLELGNTLEYISIDMAVYSYLFMISALKKNSKFTPIFKILKIIYTLFLIIMAILTNLRILHLPQFLSTSHVIAIVILLTSLISISYDFNKHQLFERVLFFGNMLLITSIIYQIIMFNVNKHFATFKKDNDYTFAAMISILIMIATFFTTYVCKWYDKLKNYQEKKLLQKLAYNDALTGLGNRQQGILTLLECMNNDNDYFILNFDLNNLKLANDTLGHSRGDKLLTDFAECLKLSFPEHCSKIRTGGDEFMVVAPNSTLNEVQEYLHHLKENIHNVNSKCNDEFFLETAIGIADSKEISSNNYEDVIKLSDQRMYDNKRKIKADKLSKIYQK